jgi:ubiquinone/menaquinone biosynthesis C-methylase UbiE
MQNVAYLFNSPREYAMNVVELPEVETAYDKVEVYDQDAINGFSEQMLTTMLDIVSPGHASTILDAMAGNGNLTLRLYDYCERRGFFPPDVAVLEFSRVQCELAREQLVDTPAKVVWGDILTMEDYENEEFLPESAFDRVMIKSGNHEIPLSQQLDLYNSIFRVLKPEGIFVNLGFLFDDVEERDQFREIARCKDSLAGMHSAVKNRHFLTRDELYTRLQQAGFVDIRCGMHVQYTISSLVVTHAYFPEHKWEYMHAEFQAQQAKAMLLRRKGRIHFQGESSTMIVPGEITVARRPV